MGGENNKVACALVIFSKLHLSRWGCCCYNNERDSLFLIIISSFSSYIPSKPLFFFLAAACYLFFFFKEPYRWNASLVQVSPSFTIYSVLFSHVCCCLFPGGLIVFVYIFVFSLFRFHRYVACCPSVRPFVAFIYFYWALLLFLLLIPLRLVGWLVCLSR